MHIHSIADYFFIDKMHPPLFAQKLILVPSTNLFLWFVLSAKYFSLVTLWHYSLYRVSPRKLSKPGGRRAEAVTMVTMVFLY